MLLNFKNFFLLLISSLISLWWEKNTWYAINIKFVKLALWPSKWPCLENVLCVLEENVYFVVIRCSVLYRPILSIMPYICYFLHNSACVIYSLLKMGIEVCSYYFVSFSLQFCLHMLYIFRCFKTGCIYIYNCHIILMNSLLYNDLLCLIWQSVQFLTKKSVLSDTNMASPALVCVPFAWNIFSHPFTFSLCAFVIAYSWTVLIHSTHLFD